MTRREAIGRIAARLAGLYDEREARSLARRLVAGCLGATLSELLTDPAREVGAEAAQRLEEAAQRLAAGTPLQYILGEADFYGRRFAVREGVLIPRPETEELVEWIVRGERAARRVLDVGTGSGCIAATLALEMPGTEVWAADLSERALETAEENCRRLGARVGLRRADALAEGRVRAGAEGTPQESRNPKGLVVNPVRGAVSENIQKTVSENFQEANSGNIREAVQGLEAVFGRGFDLIVSNPPYVPESDRATMHPNVRDHEPAEALFVPDNDRIRFYRAIARAGRRMLAPGGRLYFEIYEHAAGEVARMLADEGYTAVEQRDDLFGRPRMVRCRLNEPTR